MSVRAAPLGLRLFLEGVEVPVISASVTVQPDTPAAASIQIIPTDMGLNFLPRTLVHLFYLDSNLSADEVAAAQKVLNPSSEVRPSSNNDSLNRFEASDFAYKILFTGEVIGLNYRKNPSGRQLVLQCMDLSSYWDTCYQFFSDYSASGSGLTDKHHNFVGAGQGLFDNFGGTQWVTSRLLSTKPRSPEFQETEGLLGGIIHLLEAVGGIRYRDSKFKGFRGINDFFTIAELRYNLLGMLGAIEKDKTSQKIYANKAFHAWLKNGMTSLGNLVSFRDLLNHINRYIFHNIYPNPCAYYKEGGTTQTKKRVKAGTANLVDSAVGGVWKAEMKKILTMINDALGDVQQITYELSLVGDIARSWAAGGKVTVADKTIRDVDDRLAMLIPVVESSKTDDSAKVVKSMRSIRKTISDASDEMPFVAEGKSFNDFSKGSHGGKILERLENVQKMLEDAGNELDDLFGKEVTRFRTKYTNVPASDHLYNQLFLPECFFVSPPRCNVIFPDQYFDITYSRNFMREVSRLALQGGIGLTNGRRGAKLFSRFYLAPNIRDVRGKLLQASLSQASRVILPHEVHSGIIPKFEWVTDGHRWGVKAAVGAKKLSDVKKTQKIHYLQRLAEFNFYLHRWSSRSLSLNGLFNPNIVCGLPAVIIDRSSPSPAVQAELEKALRRRMLPTQFVGKVMTYTHSIHQGGGSTSIQFGYARTHRGLDDEFLGVLTKEVKEESAKKLFMVDVQSLVVGIDKAERDWKTFEELRQKGDSSVAQVDAKGAAQLHASISKKFVPQKLVVKMYVEKTLTVGATVKGVGKVKKIDKSSDMIIVTRKAAAHFFGISDATFDKYMVSGKYFGRDLGHYEAVSWTRASANTAVDVLEIPDFFQISYTVTRGTGRYERSDKSFEDIVRPEWMAEDVWANDKITEAVYQPLLGTYAITDDKSIGQEQQDEMLKRWQESQTKRIDFSEMTIEASTSTQEGGRARGEGTVSTETVDGNTFYTVVPGSIEETIDGLSLIYGIIKEKGEDVGEFIRNFTTRPIANIVDVLGSQNLEFDGKGNVKDPKTMIEGFHSRAFGDYNTDVQQPERKGSSAVAAEGAGKVLMPGVAEPAKLARPSIVGKTHDEGTFRPELDPRGRARKRVRAYVEELRVSKGLLSQ